MAGSIEARRYALAACASRATTTELNVVEIVSDDADGDKTDRAASAVQAIGSRVRALRIDRGLTLQGLADMTGLSPSLLSLVERGKTSPSIGTLVSVAHAFEVHMGDLVPGEPPAREAPVVRADQQQEFSTPEGVTRRVIRDDRVRGLEVAINKYAPKGKSAEQKLHHGGYEYGFVLEGVITVDLDGDTYTLHPGDSIGYDSNLPHQISNTTARPAKALWVNLDRS